MAKEKTEGASVYDLGLDNVPDLHTLEEGEHELKIMKAEERMTKDNKPFILFYCESVDDATARDIAHTLFLPDPGDREKEQIRRKNTFKEFYRALDLDLSVPLNLNNLVDMRFFAYLTVEDAGGDIGEVNRIKKFLSK